MLNLVVCASLPPPFQPVSLADREVISRLRNCLLALAAHKVLLYDTSVLYCYESSVQHQVGSSQIKNSCTLKTLMSVFYSKWLFALHPLPHKWHWIDCNNKEVDFYNTSLCDVLCHLVAILKVYSSDCSSQLCNTVWNRHSWFHCSFGRGTDDLITNASHKYGLYNTVY